MRPATVAEAALLLKGLERPIRPVGGGTKPWLPAGDEEPLETGGLDRILEHNVGDFTAVLEAGVPFADAQATFAEHGQRLAWDPPDTGGATIGGIVATADSGPLRHRYGGVRDLVVGTSVVLSDGTVAKSGGKVIKNVAGYDLAKLFAGSFGTLGLIATVSVRLHPLPTRTATVAFDFDDPDALAAKAIELARLPLEADRFDAVWRDGRGQLLVEFSGAAAEDAARRIGEPADVDWETVRALQRGTVVVKVSGRPTDLADVIRAAGDGTVISRAALGLSWIALPDASRIAAIRQALAPRHCVVLDGVTEVAEAVPGQAVMERLKARFDPARIFRPGTFVGGI
ncbi:FAD-binding oxidoreductase [Solirubrobacter soli]|uniref:FAD-binding oxidoreductase n=1 Tax=Solirubrobacter soli TaxID=363832 RepID=UPI00146E93B6|nr:FAD-binding oxidoreductase [Solirubrobacter soli]